MENNTKYEHNTSILSKLSKPPDILNGTIWKIIIKLSLPIIIAHLFQTFYNLVDAFWLGKLGKAALAAPTITFNVVFAIIALAAGLGAGGMTVLAQYKGAGNDKMVNETATNTFIVVFIISCILAVLGYIFTPQILNIMQTPVDAYSGTLKYMRIIFIGIPFVFGFYIYQGLMQGYGDTIRPMKINAITVVINVILDPILIFGLGPIPKMGVAGAAIATIFSQFISSIIGLIQLLSGKYGIKISFKNFKFNKVIIKSIFRIGIPISLGQSGTALGFTLLMGLVNTFGTSVVGAFGIGHRIISLLTTPAMGLAQGTSTIVAQNIGAKNIQRAEKSVWTAVLINGSILFIFTTLLFFFGGSVVKFFINDPDVISVGQSMFKITSYPILFFSIMIVFTAAFQGSGHTMPVFILQIARLWIFRIPLAYLLAKQLNYGPNGIFWAMFISNTIITFISYLWFKTGRWKKNIIKSPISRIIAEEEIELTQK
jgi:putative MATE family efflux protein